MLNCQASFWMDGWHDGWLRGILSSQITWLDKSKLKKFPQHQSFALQVGSPLLLLPASRWPERRNSCETKTVLLTMHCNDCNDVSLQSFTIYVVLHHIIYPNFALGRTFSYSFAVLTLFHKRTLDHRKRSNINYDPIDSPRDPISIKIIGSESILSLFLST